MKAAVLTRANIALSVITDIELPALNVGQVLIKVHYSGICRSQLMEIRGMRGTDPYLPHLLGHEASGVVMEVGRGVSKVAVGDHVVLSWIKGIGLESGGIKFKHKDQEINAGPITTFSDMSVVSENRLFKIDKGFPMDIAAFFGCAVPTGAGIILNEIPHPDGKTVAVFGLGGVGLSALMTAIAMNPQDIFAIDVSKKKLEIASELGAKTVLSGESQDVVSRIRELTNGLGVDIAIDATGSVFGIETAFDSIRKFGGKCVFASHPKQGDMLRIDPFDLLSGKSISGTWGGKCNMDFDLPRLMDLYLQGKLPVDKLLAKQYSLEMINQAFSDLENDIVIRPLIDMQA